jgi:hypothetical protein
MIFHANTFRHHGKKIYTRTHALGRTDGSTSCGVFVIKIQMQQHRFFIFFNATLCLSCISLYLSIFFFSQAPKASFPPQLTGIYTTSQKYCGMKYVALKSAYLQMRSLLAPLDILPFIRRICSFFRLRLDFSAGRVLLGRV